MTSQPKPLKPSEVRKVILEALGREGSYCEAPCRSIPDLITSNERLILMMFSSALNGNGDLAKWTSLMTTIGNGSTK
jgi:hypothetical protein